MTGGAAPSVSVIVPVRDGARHLREALDSILDQSRPPLEVIVCDDASTDATPEILASYGDRVVVRRRERNLGIYDNVDLGIREARGELCAVYHADDVYGRDIVAREADFLAAHPEVEAVFCVDHWIDAKGRRYGGLRMPPEVPCDRPLDFRLVFDALLRRKNVFLVCPTAMVRTETYRALGGYRQALFKNSADLDMWIRIARRGPIAVLSEPLMSYRHFHGSSSHRYHHLRTSPERFFEIMDHHLAEGAEEFASRDALRAYEAHRSEDLLMIAAAHYVKGERDLLRAALARVRPGAILRSPEVRRARLLALDLILRAAAPWPRFLPLARAFYRRWHAAKRPPGEPSPC